MRPYPGRVLQDAELAQLAATGDRDAWAAIYDRYADRLHDYCWSILRDRHEAQDALHDAFVTAAGKIGQLRDPGSLRSWLYAICRTTALARTRRRGREVPSEDVAQMSPPVTDSSDYELQQLRQLVWDAAGGLAPRDRSVLELHLRHGMEGQELATALGTNPHHATVLLSRVRDHVERSLGALLVGRTGRKDCATLDALLADWDGTLSPLLRKRVARHIDSCQVCTRQRSRLVSPLALLSGVPLLPAPQELRRRVLADVELASASAALRGGSSGGTSRGRTALIAGAAVLMVLAVLGAALVVTRRADLADLAGRGPVSATGTAAASTTPAASSASATSTPTTTAQGTTSAAPVTTPAPAPAALDVLTPSLDFAGAATELALRLRNSGGQPLRWSVTSDHAAVTVQPAAGTLAPGSTAPLAARLNRSTIPDGAFAAQLRVSVVSGPVRTVPVRAVHNRPPVISGLSSTPAWLVSGSTGLGCQSARVSAVVTDANSPLTVTLHWVRPGGAVTRTAMSGSGGRYSAAVVLSPGPPTDSDIRWWIVATDSAGNSAQSANQVIDVRSTGPCPA